MNFRDAMASAMAAASIAGISTSTAFLAGTAWWGVLTASVLVLVAAILLTVAQPDEELPAPSVVADDHGTVRTTMTGLGVPLEESRQNVVPKIGRAVGQLPEFYEDPEPPAPTRAWWRKVDIT